MKPEMARLLYEVVAATNRASGQLLSIDELYGLLGADAGAKQERVRNAVTRLCGSRHLKKVATGYAFLRDYDTVPSPVASLFPSSTAQPPSGSKSSVRPQKLHAGNINALRTRLVSVAPPAPPSKKASRGSVLEAVLSMLADSGAPLAGSAVAEALVLGGVTSSRGAVVQCLNALAKRGKILRTCRGIYAAVPRDAFDVGSTCVDAGLDARADAELDAGGDTCIDSALNAVETEVLKASVSASSDLHPDERRGLEPPPSLHPDCHDDDASTLLEDDILHLEHLVTLWQAERDVAALRIEDLDTRIRRFKANIAWRKAALQRFEQESRSERP